MLKTFKDKIKQAMREKDTRTRSILRLVLGKAKDIAKERKTEEERIVTDKDLLIATQRQVKQLKETIAELTKAGRDKSFYESELAEIEILSEYLPKQMTNEDITALVKTVIDTIPEENRNMKQGKGLAMKGLAKYRDTIDMKFAGEEVNKALQGG